MSLDTITLQCFLAANDLKNISKAAEIVNRSQSAVSQQISKLEEILGKELFIREKNLKLTKDGEIFLSYAKEIFALQQEVINRFKNPEVEGEVRFGLPEDFANSMLSDVLISFARIHPRISLTIECDLTLNLYRRFKNGKFDLVLLKMSRPDEFHSGIDVWSEKLVWVGDERLLSSGNFSKAATPLVLSPKPCVYRSQAIDALNKFKKKWRISFESQSHASKIAAVKAGLGLTVMPRNMVPDDLAILYSKNLPKLQDAHISLLKKSNCNLAVNSFEEFALKKLNHI
jgi:DNA-binding transcriptional LysR family regulator